ncbi:unnamed protein product [Amoebophrya sp. A120]|nr:unnamed protein product [Amoebophrya sp. A120]|eukprot:GSA120T00006342001.1
MLGAKYYVFVAIAAIFFYCYVIDEDAFGLTITWHCPLHSAASIVSWPTPEACYWSRSYTEAREKFRILGVTLRDQVLPQGDIGAHHAQTSRSAENTSIKISRQKRVEARNRALAKLLGGSRVESIKFASVDVHDENNARSGDGKKIKLIDGFNDRERAAANTVDAVVLTVATGSVDVVESNPASSDGATKDNHTSNSDGPDASPSKANLNGAPSGRRDQEIHDVIHSSGTHGAEAYAGSAIQVQFLQELLREIVVGSSSARGSFVPQGESPDLHEKGADVQQDLLDDADTGSARARRSNAKIRKILLVHCINPFGMRHYRRFNENNVDLMRNALSREEAVQVRSRDPNIAGYEDLDYILNPYDKTAVADTTSKILLDEDDHVSSGSSGKAASLQHEQPSGIGAAAPPEQAYYSRASELNLLPALQEIAVFLRCVFNAGKELLFGRGYAKLKRALVAAQYHRPTALWYGGVPGKWEPSVRILQYLMNTFAEMEDRDRVWIDVHTGLGPYGEYVLLPGLKELPFAGGALEEKNKHRMSTLSAGDEKDANFTGRSVENPQPPSTRTSLYSAKDATTRERGNEVIHALVDKARQIFFDEPIDDGGLLFRKPVEAARSSTQVETPDFASVREGYELTQGALTGAALCPPTLAPGRNGQQEIDQPSGRDRESLKDEQARSTQDRPPGLPPGAARKPSATCLAFVQEFGTRPGILVAMEHRQFVLGNKKTDGWMNRFAFNPQRWSWRNLVAHGGKRILWKALNNVTTSAAPPLI